MVGTIEDPWEGDIEHFEIFEDAKKKGKIRAFWHFLLRPSGESGKYYAKSQPATIIDAVQIRCGSEDPRKTAFRPNSKNFRAKVWLGVLLSRITSLTNPAKPFLNSMTSRLKIFKPFTNTKNFRQKRSIDFALGLRSQWSLRSDLAQGSVAQIEKLLAGDELSQSIS